MTRTDGAERIPAHWPYAARALLLIVFVWATRAGAFQEAQRINSLTLQFGKDSFATANAFGGAFTSLAQSQLQPVVGTNVVNGSVSILFEMPGLSDLTGTTAPSLQMGMVNAKPVLDTNNPTTYSGSADLDWWYTAEASGVDANGVPKAQMDGSIVAKALNAFAGELVFTSGPLGTPGAMSMSSVVMKATVGGASAPLESTNGFAPGHLPSEHLDPSPSSFDSLTNGQMKGNISAASLAAMPFDLNITTDQGYTTNNSILDVLVSGATTLGGFVRLVNVTQPDQVDTNVPAAGAGPPYKFTVNASKVVIGCLDKNGASVPLVLGLSAAAYSAYFTFTTDRVIAHNLQPGTAQAPAIVLVRAGNNINLNVVAQDTTTCTIEYKPSLSDSNWLWLQTITGTGGPSTIIDSNLASQTRFYRAQVQ